ncbi:prepilin-type N-terminal cleavage/methylation domain-containing protein [Clostridium chromiireducens]|uniref:Prepilin-type N-terminal cleavage/methylation domain-containing protein n=1 Tax=Clostridium chromiireducens TaxID=225345 RepID=A0A964W114_9CLOT|nr:prepilin-type N-terminal cleavage/methylation domain-containing protein [Clostridium chromiireducens]MVX62572.1 prepilin-type N-terminal cleavage/methylation domain-containing protein [Clostridium chromiireducens]
MNQLSIRKRNELATKKKKGFTLIELIIVIAIIAILAAIAIPKFGQVKKDANFRADQANAKIIATAVAQAVSEGEITATADVTDAKIAKYIDGGAMPKSKTTGGSFTVTYDPPAPTGTGKGTKITMTDGATTQVVYGS